MALYKTIVSQIYHSRYILAYTVATVLIASAFFYKLNTLTPGPHSLEISNLFNATALNFSNLWDSLVFLPQLLLTKLFNLLLGASAMSIRLSSVVFAASMIPMLYYILYVWHTRRIATLGIILMLSSSWFVGLARFGTPDIMYAWGAMAAITAMTMVFHHRRHTKRRMVIMATAGLLAGLSLYVPYTLYIYLLALAIASRFANRLFKELSAKELAMFLTMVGILFVPLMIGVLLNPSAGLTLLGLPSSGIPPEPLIILSQMKDMFSNLFWRSDGSIAISLGNLPLLSIFGVSLAALGMYHYEQHLKNLRTHLVIGMFFGLFLLLAIDYNSAKTASLLPFAYILIAMGAVTLLTQWYRIFPKNPFARTIGLLVMALFIGLNLVYNHQRFFVAWANSPETKLSFSNDVLVVNRTVQQIKTDTEVDSLLLITRPDPSQRLSVWLEDKHPQTTIETVNLINFNASPDLIIIQDGINRDNLGINWNNYLLYSSVDTTSQVDPISFEFWLGATE